MNESTTTNRNTQTNSNTAPKVSKIFKDTINKSRCDNDIEDKLNFKGDIKIKTPQIYTITSQSLILILLLSFSVASLKSKFYNLIFIFFVGYFYFNAMNYDLLMFKIFLTKEKEIEIRERINEQMVKYGFLKKLNIPAASNKFIKEEVEDLNDDLNSLNKFIEHFWEKIYIHLSAYVYKEININLNPLKNYVQLKKFLLSTPPKFKTISLKIIENNLEINLKVCMSENENLIEVLLGLFKVKIPLRISDLRFQIGIKIIIKLNDILDILNIENKKYEQFYINLENKTAPQIGILGSDLSDHLKVIFKNQEFLYKKLINLHVFLHEIPEIKFNLTPLNSFDVMSYMQLQRVVNSVIERVCKDLVKNGLILNLRDVNDKNYSVKNFYSLELKQLCLKQTSLKIEGVEVICLEKDSPLKIFSDLNISKYGKLSLTETLTPLLDTYLSKYSIKCSFPLKFNFLGKANSFLILFYTNKGIMTSFIDQSLFNIKALRINIYKCSKIHSSHVINTSSNPEVDTFFSKYNTKNIFYDNCCKVKGLCILYFNEGILGDNNDSLKDLSYNYFYLKLLIDSPQPIKGILFHKPFISKRDYLKKSNNDLKETYLKGSLKVGNGNTAVFNIPCKDNSIELVTTGNDYLSFFTEGSKLIDLEVLHMFGEESSSLETRNYLQLKELIHEINEKKEVKILNGVSIKILDVRDINYPGVYPNIKNTNQQFPPQSFLKLYMPSHTIKRNIDEYSLIIEVQNTKKLIRCDLEPVVYIPIDDIEDRLDFTACLLRNNKQISKKEVTWDLNENYTERSIKIDKLNFKGTPLKIEASSSSSRLSHASFGIEEESLEKIINIPIELNPSISNLMQSDTASKMDLLEDIKELVSANSENDSIFNMSSRTSVNTRFNTTPSDRGDSKSTVHISKSGLNNGKEGSSQNQFVSPSDEMFLRGLSDTYESTGDKETRNPVSKETVVSSEDIFKPLGEDLKTINEEEANEKEGELTESKVGVLLEEVIKIPKTIEIGNETRKNHIFFENEFIFNFDFAIQKYDAELSPTNVPTEINGPNTFYIKINPIPLEIEDYYYEITESQNEKEILTRESLNTNTPLEILVNRENKGEIKNNLKLKIFKKQKEGEQIFEGYLNYYSETSILLNFNTSLKGSLLNDSRNVFKSFMYDDMLILPFKKSVYRTELLKTPVFNKIELYVESIINLKTVEESLNGNQLEELFGINYNLKNSLFFKIFHNKKCIYKSKGILNRNVFLNQLIELNTKVFNKLDFLVYQKKKPAISSYKVNSDTLLLLKNSSLSNKLSKVIKKQGGSSFNIKYYPIASYSLVFERDQLYRDFQIKRELTGSLDQSSGIMVMFDIKRVL